MVKHFAWLVFVVDLEEVIVPALLGVHLAVKSFNDVALHSKMTFHDRDVCYNAVACLFILLAVNHQSENSELKLSHLPLSSAHLCSRVQRAAMTWTPTTPTPCPIQTPTVTTTMAHAVLGRSPPCPTTASVPWAWPTGARWQVCLAGGLIPSWPYASVLYTLTLFCSLAEPRIVYFNILMHEINDHFLLYNLGFPMHPPFDNKYNIHHCSKFESLRNVLIY